MASNPQTLLTSGQGQTDKNNPALQNGNFENLIPPQMLNAMPGIPAIERKIYLDSLNTGKIKLNGTNYQAIWNLEKKLSLVELKSALENDEVKKGMEVTVGDTYAKSSSSYTNYSTTTVNGSVISSNGSNHSQTLINSKPGFTKIEFYINKAKITLTLKKLDPRVKSKPLIMNAKPKAINVSKEGQKQSIESQTEKVPSTSEVKDKAENSNVNGIEAGDKAVITTAPPAKKPTPAKAPTETIAERMVRLKGVFGTTPNGLATIYAQSVSLVRGAHLANQSLFQYLQATPAVRTQLEASIKAEAGAKRFPKK